MQLKWPMLWDLFSLFPAYAGVIPSYGRHLRYSTTFPRIRGGDPDESGEFHNNKDFSPHTRG